MKNRNLRSTNFTKPRAESGIAGAAEHVFAGGFKVSLHDVDRALKERSTLNVSQRIQFKSMLDRYGLLKQ